MGFNNLGNFNFTNGNFWNSRKFIIGGNKTPEQPSTPDVPDENNKDTNHPKLNGDLGFPPTFRTEKGFFG